jgi:Flp pilus assembly protein TadD
LSRSLGKKLLLTSEHSRINVVQMSRGHISQSKTIAARPALVAAVLALSIGVVYGPFLAVPFIYDDQAAIVENESIKSLWPLIGTQDHPRALTPRRGLPTTARPLVNFSFAVNYYFGGLRPTGYHAVNIVIHVLSSFLLWAIVRRTLRLPYFAGRFETSADWVALAVAIIWALHPLVTESVIYATQRTELAFAFFYLATLYCSIRYWTAILLPFREGQGEGFSSRAKSRVAKKGVIRHPSPLPNSPGQGEGTGQAQRQRSIWLLLAVLACFAGMTSKEVMVSAPLIVLLFERTFIAGSLSKAFQRSWPLYVGLALTWFLLALLARIQLHSGAIGFGLAPLGSWWLTQTHVLLIYLKLAVWPSPLMIHYDIPYLTTVSDALRYEVLALILGIVTLLLLWRNHPVGFLGTCVFAILAPSSLVPIPLEIAAERRMYLPLAALIVLFVVGGYRAIQWLMHGSSSVRSDASTSRLPQRAIVVATLPIALACGLASAHRLADYRNEVDLWRPAATLHPNDYVARDTLGLLLLNSGQTPEAIDEFQAALALRPDDADALNNLGHAYLAAERIQEAVDKFQAAIAIRPEFALGHNNLGVAFRMLDRLPESIEQLQQARTLQPNLYPARLNLGRSLLLAHRSAEAVEELQAALALKPDDLPTLTNLALAYSQMGQSARALETAEKAIEQAGSTGQQATVEQLEDWVNRHRNDSETNDARPSKP